jgi:hypothetical protein
MSSCWISRAAVLVIVIASLAGGLRCGGGTTGHLTKNCGATAGYCYYLGAQVPVNTFGNSTVLDPFVGRDVLIVGKVVFPATGTGEVWPGTICRVTR